MGTAHNEAELGQIAKTVLMPGDPLRAKFIAETFLTDVKCFNTVRNMLGFTGKYNGKEVSVMGAGMGMPSIGIYSYVVMAMGACTDSRYSYQYELPGDFAPIADYSLLEKAVGTARELKIPVKVGNVVSSDVFYNGYTKANEKWASMGALCVEMEAAALYMNAAKAGKKALAILSISDHILKGTELSPEERKVGFKDMMEIALRLA